MPYPWKNWQDRSLQTHELKNAIDSLWDAVVGPGGSAQGIQMVHAAYGGMRYQTNTPITANIGTTPVKVTLYDEEMPLFGEALHVSFDSVNDDVVIADNQGGVYEVSLFFNYQGEQGEIYTIDVRLDNTSIGNPILARVSNADPYAELQLSTIGRINGGGRWSVWVNANKNNTRFNVFGTSLYFIRISTRMDDVSPARSLDFGGGGEIPENGDNGDDDDDEDDDD